MNASLDTDIIIHLYKAGKQDILFSFSNELFIYEYLVNTELKAKGQAIYGSFVKDVNSRRVKIISNSDLVSYGIKGLFENYVQEYQYLFDQGELYAVALAKAMGLFALVSDDTKDFGPHDTLVRELIEDVVPFAFYELLFLKYINSEITMVEFHHEFDSIVGIFEWPMQFYGRMLRTVRRFGSNGTRRDKDWMMGFCSSHSINYNKKMLELKEYLKTL